MEQESVLLTFTQVTVAFVGFAAIVSTFRFKDQEKIKKNDAIELQMIVNTGLVGAFFSVFPLALHSFNIQENLIWAYSSGLMSLNYAAFMYYLYKRIDFSKFRRRSSKLLIIVYFIIGTILLILNVCNAFGVVFDQEFGPFLLTLIYPLCIVGYMFTRIIFIPIWRNLRKQGNSN